MSDLLTHQEYQAIASQLHYPCTAFINGTFRPGNGKILETINPASGEKIADIAACHAGDVDFAVSKAREAFDEGHWSKMTPGKRKSILIRLCKLMTRNRHELAVLESVESGKPIQDCVRIDLPESIECIQWHAEAADKIYDQTAPLQDDAIAMIVREPIGVVAAILPWNFPMLMMAWKIGPALASGNSVIVKPAEQTSMSALRIAELAYEAGVPRGVLQVLPGDGPSVGKPLGMHMDVDMVSFTGSTETGRRFLGYAADSNLKKVVLECGGKNPSVVLNDAENLDSVATHIVNGAFWNAGQNCSAISRLIVQSGVKSTLLDKVKQRLRDWPVGDPLHPKTQIGALIDDEHAKKVAGYMTGNAFVGGNIDGNFCQPTIYEIDADSPLAKEEIFGPILAVMEVSTADEAMQIANATPYGLTASIFSSNGRQALRAAKDIKAGTVTVNCYGEGDLTTPFGGYKQSGFGGRDNGLHAHEQYTELKTIWINLENPKDGDVVG